MRSNPEDYPTELKRHLAVIENVNDNDQSSVIDSPFTHKFAAERTTADAVPRNPMEGLAE